MWQLFSLFAAVGLGISWMSSDAGGVGATQAATVQALYATLKSQTETIRARIGQCVIENPSGNNGTAFKAEYPGAPVPVALAGISCPGAPPASALIWSGRDGIFAPQPPGAFAGPYAYVNDALGVRVMLVAAVSGDQAAAAAAQRLVGRYGPGQAGWSSSTLTVWLSR